MMFRDRAVRLKIPVLQIDGEYVYQFGQPPSGAEAVAQRFAGSERLKSGFGRERIAAPRTGALCPGDSRNPVFWEDNPVSIFRGGESSPSKPLARGKLSPRTSCPFTFLDSYRKCAPLWLDKSSAN